MPDILQQLSDAVAALSKRVADLEAHSQVPNQALDTTDSPTFAAITNTGGLNAGTATGAVAGQFKLAGTAANAQALNISVPMGSILAVDDTTDNLVWFNVRPNSGKGGVLMFTESGVADRYQIGIKPSDGTLYFMTGVISSPTTRMTLSSAGVLTVTGAFGCNGATARTAAASGGAVAPGAGAFGASSAVNFAALVTLVANIRTALVNNGIMS